MKRHLALVLVVAIVAAVLARRTGHDDTVVPAPPPASSTPASSAPAPSPAREDGSLARAIAARAQEVPVTGRGTVIRLLADDREGSPHQRILLRVAGGGTVLIAHNLDLSPRVAPLAVGDQLEFAGDYVWNENGGVVHWTHPYPQGRHRAGWVRRVDRP